MSDLRDNRELETLVGLVRKTITNGLSPREQFGVVRLEQAWQREQPPRRSRRLLGTRALAAALAVATVFPVGFIGYRHLTRLTYQIVNGTAGADGLIVETRPGTVVVFSEGSRLDVSGATRARVASTTPDGGRVVLEDGDVRADIVHRPRARWTVDAGPYSIRVTGTSFDVRWSAANERLDFQMNRGSVVVTGPLIPAGVTLTTGMRLTAHPRAGRLAIGDGADTHAEVHEPVAAAAHAAAEAPVAVDGVPDGDDRGLRARPTRGARRDGARRGLASDGRRRDGDRNWGRQLAEGDFQAVLADAESRGLEQVLGSASGSDLAALSDAARYTHHVATARRALLALRVRFPHAAPAQDSAFFLGGLAETDASAGAGGREPRASQRSAVDWYNQYVHECPTGRFVGEAWGRKMVLTQWQLGSEAARPIAEEYLRRFPRGPYVAAARKLVQAP